MIVRGSAFRRSSYCGGGACVEVAALVDGKVAVRDAKAPNLDARIFDRDEWAAFIEGVKAGEFDLDVLDCRSSTRS